MSAKSIMIQGTMSSVGKSMITAGICRVFMQDGYIVSPFKSQNMALNSFITKDGKEMGRAQVVQAKACGKIPDVRMNPILLKPSTKMGAQVILNGKSIGNYNSVEYHKIKGELKTNIQTAYDSLAKENDIIVIEGAGSTAEINLQENDIVNMGLAKMIKSPVILVGDIDRGGVFAQIYGTCELVKPEENELIMGIVINKFRGDIEHFKNGIEMIENLTRKKVLGVVPYFNLDIEDEDSVSEKLQSGDQIKDIDIVIIKLPRMSNFTDFDIFSNFDNVSIRYVDDIKKMKNPDMIILPGTKNTIEDFLWLKTSGMESIIKKHVSIGGVLFGICGGYQMLGEKIQDLAEVENGGEVEGLGYIKMNTIFKKKKHTVQKSGVFQGIEGIFHTLNQKKFDGYEIHNGESSITKVISSNKNVYGTYVHGIFDSGEIAETILHALAKKKGIKLNLQSFDYEKHKEKELDKLADIIRNSLNIEKIYEILKIKR